MLLPKQKVVYIHVPKTGGTSISYVLNKSYSGYNFSNSDHRAEHLPYFYYKKYLSEINLDIKDFFVFSFVRNPYERFYSHWKFFLNCFLNKSGQNYENLKYYKIEKELKDVNTFVNYIFNSFNDYKSGKRSKLLNILCSVFMPQCFWIGDPFNLNFLGRFENFSNDFKKVYYKIYKKQYNLDVPKINSSTNYYFSGFNEESIEKIKYMFKIDFIKLDYSF